MHNADAGRMGNVSFSRRLRGREPREEIADLVCGVVRVRDNNGPVEEGKVASCDVVDFAAQGAGDDPDEACAGSKTLGCAYG